MTDSTVLPDFCAVCGDKASKWRYSQYGATSCFSCRTFYRRSLENIIYKKYKCKSTNGPTSECVVNSKTRKKCAYCRFQKCRQVGMRHGQPHWPANTENESEPPARPTKTSKENDFCRKSFDKEPMKVTKMSTEDDFHHKNFDKESMKATKMSTEDDFYPKNFDKESMKATKMSTENDFRRKSIEQEPTRETKNEFRLKSFDVLKSQDCQTNFDENYSENYSPIHSQPDRLTIISSNQPSPCQDDIQTKESTEMEHSKDVFLIPVFSLNDLSPKMVWTAEESLRIEKLFSADRNSMIGFRDMFTSAFSFTTLRKFLLSILTGRTLEFSAMCWGYACGIQKLTRFALDIEEFVEVTAGCETTKKALLLHNIDPMFNIRNAYFFQSDAPSLICQLERFGIFDMTLLKTFAESIGNITADVIGPMTWRQYFVTPWADSFDQELKYEFLMSSLHQLSLNHETTCLLSVVALFRDGIYKHS